MRGPVQLFRSAVRRVYLAGTAAHLVDAVTAGGQLAVGSVGITKSAGLSEFIKLRFGFHLSCLAFLWVRPDHILNLRSSGRVQTSF